MAVNLVPLTLYDELAASDIVPASRCEDRSMTAPASPIDAARIELLLSDLHLPGVKAIWPTLAAQSDREAGQRRGSSPHSPSTKLPIRKMPR